MSAIRVKARIPESREITLTLPPDVPTGDAELEIVVRESPPQEFVVTLPEDTRPRVFPSRPTHPVLAAEHDAFETLLPELMKIHAGKYVAVSGGEVVAVADSEVGALTEAHRVKPDVLSLVRRVTDQPQPLPRIPSLRATPAE